LAGEVWIPIRAPELARVTSKYSTFASVQLRQLPKVGNVEYLDLILDLTPIATIRMLNI
ncbi:MAG: hypothetical protein QOE88_2304, partial [Verrucomicrobiota bacterium]|nr:hypothetical protein [Verrucomicrobiota bacterium]